MTGPSPAVPAVRCCRQGEFTFRPKAIATLQGARGVRGVTVRRSAAATRVARSTTTASASRRALAAVVGLLLLGVCAAQRTITPQTPRAVAPRGDPRTVTSTPQAGTPVETATAAAAAAVAAVAAVAAADADAAAAAAAAATARSGSSSNRYCLGGSWQGLADIASGGRAKAWCLLIHAEASLPLSSPWQKLPSKYSTRI
jgi:hypothetical protein